MSVSAFLKSLSSGNPVSFLLCLLSLLDFSVWKSWSLLGFPLLLYPPPHVEPTSQRFIFNFLSLLHILSPGGMLFPSFILLTWPFPYFCIEAGHSTFFLQHPSLITEILWTLAICPSMIYHLFITYHCFWLCFLSNFREISKYLLAVWPEYFKDPFLLSLLLIPIYPPNLVNSISRGPLILTSPRATHTPQSGSSNFFHFLFWLFEEYHCIFGFNLFLFLFIQKPPIPNHFYLFNSYFSNNPDMIIWLLG